MDAKTSNLSALALIAIPRRATTADLVQTVIANDTARRSQQGLTSASTIRSSRSTAAGTNAAQPFGGPLVSAKIPSNRLFWLFIRRAIELDPVGTQEAPLFMLTDSITKDSMMMNQKMFHELVVRYEEQGAGDAAEQRRLLAADGGADVMEDSTRGHSGVRRGSSGGGAGTTEQDDESFLFGLPSFLGFSGLNGSFGLRNMGMGSSNQNSPSLAAKNASMAPLGFGGSGNRGPSAGRMVVGADSFALPPSASGTQYPLLSQSIYERTGGAQQIRGSTKDNNSPNSFHPQQSVSFAGLGGYALPPPAAAAHAASSGRRAVSSLLTVTVTASTGQLRTFRASQQFWDHVLLEYHTMLERQMHTAMEASSSPGNKQRGGRQGLQQKKSSPLSGAARKTFAEEDDELSLLRSAQQEEQDRLVLTIAVNTYDAQRELAAQRRWLKKLSSGARGSGLPDAGSEGLLRSSLKKNFDQQPQSRVSFFTKPGEMTSRSVLSGEGESSGYTDPLELSGRQREDDEADDDEADTFGEDDVNRVKSIQLCVSEWRQVVDAWDTATAVLLHESEPPQGTSAAKGQRPSVQHNAEVYHDPLAPLSALQGAADGTRPRSAAVVDPNTTEDLVHDALQRMRTLEQQRHSFGGGGGGGGGGSGVYWTHFMNHWKVLEAQYRNYL